MRYKNIVFGFVLAISVLCTSLLPSFASAVDMSPNAHPIWANANPTCAFYIPASDVWQNNAFSNNSTNQTYSVSMINCDYPAGLNTVKTYAVYSFRLDNFAYDNSADSGWLASKIRSVSGSADWGVVGQNISAAGATGWQLDLYLYSTTASNGGTFQIFNPIYANEIMYLKPNERIYFVGASYWQVDGATNYSSAINSISSQIGSTNSKLDDVNSNLNDLKSSQEQANQDANDRYEDEKDTINDNTDSGKDTMEGIANDTSFSLPNPFRGIMSGFANTCSVDISVIALWLHSPTSTYDSWWCTSNTLKAIRNSLTPIFSFVSVILVFKFCWRWLATNEGEA